MNFTIRGLTVHQPHAWAIVAKHKPIENRSWKPSGYMFGQWIAIHAGKQWDEHKAIDLLAGWQGAQMIKVPEGIRRLAFCLETETLGCIVGVAQLTSYIIASSSPWFSGPYGWTLANALALPEPVPCRGAQGLWKLPVDVAVKVFAGMLQVRPGLTLGDLAS